MSKNKCPCGYIILADTEDWETPLCFSCYFELTKKTKDYQQLQSKHTALLEQVEKLVDRLKNSTYFQNGAKNYLEHHENCNIEDYDMPDDEACMCGLDNFSQDNHVSVCISKQAILEYEAFKKEQGL